MKIAFMKEERVEGEGFEMLDQGRQGDQDELRQVEYFVGLT